MHDLENIRTALAAMSDTELAAMHVAAEETTITPSTSGGLYAAVAHACDWELHRRRGIDFALAGPQEAIDPKDFAASLTTLVTLGAAFHAQPRVQALLDAIGEALMEPPPTVQ